jgi:hypothetical protein
LFGHACAQHDQAVVSADGPKEKDGQDGTKDQKCHELFEADIVNKNTLKNKTPLVANTDQRRFSFRI